jgi:hypothetical protein
LNPKEHPTAGAFYKEDEEPATALSSDELKRRVLIHRFGDGGSPIASVVVIHHYTTDGWWEKLYESVAVQQRLSAWELVEVENYDNALSLGEARNAGVDSSSGTYVMFADDDDWLHPKCVSTLLDFKVEVGADVVRSRAVMVDRHGRSVDTAHSPFGLCERELLLKHPFQRRNLLEDYELQERLKDEHGVRFESHPKSLYYYRMHNDQISAPLKKRVYDWIKSMGYET